jgi:hypothetical protein
MSAAALPIPTFLPSAGDRLAVPAPLPRSLVAAIRWDYEYGLLSQNDLVRKYAEVASATSVRGIASLRRHPDILAVRNDGAHCNPKWRLPK